MLDLFAFVCSFYTHLPESPYGIFCCGAATKALKLIPPYTFIHERSDQVNNSIIDGCFVH